MSKKKGPPPDLKNDFKQELREDYEHSLFRLAAFQALEREGETWREEMEQIPAEDRIYPSDQQREHFKRQIEKELGQRKWSQRRQRLSPLVNAVAVLALVVAIVFSTLVISVEAVRHRVFNVFLTKEVESTIFQLEEVSPEGSNAYMETTSGYWPGYVPEGYYLVEREVNSRNTRTVYMLDEEHYIVLTEASPGARIHLDSENADREEQIWINDNEYEALLIEKEGHISITWHAHERIFSLRTGVSREESVEIAESIIYKN